MWIETRHVLSPEFLQFFKSYRDSNTNNWNSATCSLAILHWAALGGGFLHLLPDGGSTVNLGDISNQINAREDGTQVGSLQYIHKWTGLKKILEFYSTLSDEKIQLSFFWKDNKSQEASMIFNKGISLDVFVLDLYGETVMDVYFVHHIWKLITMANVGLIYDVEEKREYLQSLLNSTHDNQYKQEFYKQLLILGLSVLQGHPGLEYLVKAWALNATDYHLHFVVTHIHKILVNYDSELLMYKPEENPKAARSKIENGKHTFEAFYICKRSGAERKLIITETITANTRRKLYIKFGHQVIKMNEEQLKNLSKLSFPNLWIFSANVRVNLICERRMDKLNELMSAFFNADTPGKRHFVQLLLNDFTCNLEVYKHQLHWWNQLLCLEPDGVFNEVTFFKLFKADYILREGRIRVYEMLRTGWDADKPGAFHLVAFFIHLALINCNETFNLLKTGAGNTEMIAARNYYLKHNDKRTLEAKYQFADSGKIERLLVMEGVKDEFIVANFGRKYISFYIPDLVKGQEWKLNADNLWKWPELNKQVKLLLAKDSHNNEGLSYH